MAPPPSPVLSDKAQYIFILESGEEKENEQPEQERKETGTSGKEEIDDDKGWTDAATHRSNTTAEEQADATEDNEPLWDLSFEAFSDFCKVEEQ
jgi:hypothetical protein